MKDIAIPLINLSNHGGIRIIVELANYLAEKEKTITIYIPKDKKNTIYKINEKIKIKEINTIINNKHISYFIFLALIWLNLRKHELIICNFFPTAYPAILSKLTNNKQKTLYFVQGIESIYKKNILGKLLNLLCNTTYKFNIEKIAANKKIQKTLSEKSKKEIKNINIGLSEIFFEQKKGDEKKFDILYFLRKEEWKRKEEIEKIKIGFNEKYGEIKILCISQDEKLLEEFSKKNFHVKKPKNDQELIEIIDSCKINVFTSKYEGFGLPPLECMSRGIPAISYFCTGTSIYIDNEKNSFIVNSPDEAIEKIKLLLDNNEKYKEISKEAEKTAQQYRNEKSFETFNEIISK